MATVAYSAGFHVQIPFSKLIVDRMDCLKLFGLFYIENNRLPESELNSCCIQESAIFD